MLYTVVKPNSYQDSINLMLLTNRINALDGVVQSQIMMGTDANKDIYEAAGHARGASSRSQRHGDRGGCRRCVRRRRGAG